jgi:hypothetical protein
MRARTSGLIEAVTPSEWPGESRTVAAWIQGAAKFRHRPLAGPAY